MRKLVAVSLAASSSEFIDRIVKGSNTAWDGTLRIPGMSSALASGGHCVAEFSGKPLSQKSMRELIQNLTLLSSADLNCWKPVLGGMATFKYDFESALTFCFAIKGLQQVHKQNDSNKTGLILAHFKERVRMFPVDLWVELWEIVNEAKRHVYGELP